MAIDLVPDYPDRPGHRERAGFGADSDALFEDSDEAVWDVAHRVAEALQLKEPDLDSVLSAVLAVTTELIEDVRGAGLNLYERGRFTPQAVLGAEPPRLDALQKRTGTGPCIEASRDQTVVHVEDLRTDRRWPEFAELAVSLDVLAMLCVPMRVDDIRLGSLSLYYARPEHLRGRDEQVARLLGTQAALVIADVRRTDNLRRALENRDVIGQAKGILMERRRITAARAFDVLSRSAQAANRKLVEIAAEFVETGALPGDG